MYERNVVFINVYGPNADDKTFFEPLYYFLEENEENEFIIGGDWFKHILFKLICT